jgi:hypothetical protein
MHGETLKITLMAPPVANAANTALLAFLAVLLKVPRASISLVSGEKSREKKVLVSILNPQHITQRLECILLRVDKKRADD